MSDEEEYSWLEEEPEPEKKDVAKISETEVAFVRMRNKLGRLQRILLDASLATRCSKEANDLFLKVCPGAVTNRHTLSRWRQSATYKMAMELAQQHLLENDEAFTRNGVLHRNEHIFQEAMEKKPILYKGVPTGYEERNLGSAIQALDQRSKILKLYDDDKSNAVVNLNIDFGSYGGGTIEGEAVEVTKSQGS